MRKTVYAVCSMIPTFHVSEIPRLLQAYVDERTGF